MWFSKKRLKALKKEIKKEVLLEFNNKTKKEINADVHEKLQSIWDSLTKELVKLNRRVSELEEQLYKIERSKYTGEAVSRQFTERNKEKDMPVKTEQTKNETTCEKFNRLINSSELTDEFKSINLSFVRDKLVVVNEGEALFYIVKRSEDVFELYPNQKFKDSRALVKAKEVFDFDVQGTSEIKVEQPCEVKALLDGYGISKKGKVCVL